MLDFNLQNEVIADFESIYTIKKVTLTTNDIGRQVENIVISTIKAHIRTATFNKTIQLNKMGYTNEQFIKISCNSNIAINKDDIINYLGKEFRILDIKVNETGNYTKAIGGLLND